MLSLVNLRTYLLASFIAVVITACGGSSSNGAPSNDDPVEEDALLQAGQYGLLDFEFLEEAEGLAHSTHRRIDVIPSSGKITLSASFTSRPENVRFHIITSDGQETLVEEQLVQYEQEEIALGLDQFYMGDFLAPTGNFRIRYSGVSSNVGDFSIELPKVYPQN